MTTVPSDNPKDIAHTLHAQGMRYIQEHQFEKALPLLQQAVALLPSQAEFHNNLANTYKKLHHTDLALQHYHEALRLQSPYPQAHNNLGTLLYKIGHFEEALSHFQKALRMDPQLVDAHFNAGLSFVKMNQFLEAIPHFESVLRLFPTHLGANHNLGILFCVLQHYSHAEALLQYAVQCEPNNIQALYHLGVVQNHLGQLEAALSTYQRVVDLDPHHANAHHNLATLYLHMKQPDAAREHYQIALSLDPHNSTAAHLIEALSGKTPTTGAPLQYIRTLFDQYAFHYDEHVQSELHYHVPSLLRAALAPYALHITHPWDALDLGCGTGLCAPVFADMVSRLTGVDISTNMIALAKKRGGYHQLITDDILHFLSSPPQQYDLIIAADVLVYFGDLIPLFQLIQHALKPGGLVCFSIETLSTSDSFQLLPTGRYAHSTDHIQRMVTTLNYAILHQDSAVLRLHEGSPIEGQIIVMKSHS